MAWQQTDVDALKAAMALGAVEVRYADGRQVRYRSLAEMETLLAQMQAEVAGVPSTLADSRVASGYVGNLSRGTPVWGPGCCGGGDTWGNW